MRAGRRVSLPYVPLFHSSWRNFRHWSVWHVPPAVFQTKSVPRRVVCTTSTVPSPSRSPTDGDDVCHWPVSFGQPVGSMPAVLKAWTKKPALVARISGGPSPVTSATAGPVKNCQSSMTRGKAGICVPVVALQTDSRWSKTTGVPSSVAKERSPFPTSPAM